MEKIYCEHCKYRDYDSYYESNICTNHSNLRIAEDAVAIKEFYETCQSINYKHDCKYFEKKLTLLERIKKLWLRM